MRIGVLGRTSWLIASAEAVAAAGHDISFVQTCAPESYYQTDALEYEALAKRHGAPFLSEPSIRKAMEFWRSSGTEACISLNWPTLIPEAALGVFVHGILNAHAGDLPRYRGNACPNWAILNFEARVGLTIHRMTKELDAGPCLYKTHMPLDEETYIGDIYAWLAAAIPLAFVAAIDRLSGPDVLPANADVRPLRAFPRRPEDARIDWRAPTRAILALVRASSHPFDGAITALEGQEIIRVFRATRFLPDFDFLAVPGQVCLSNRGNPVIATGDGMVEIEECSSSSGGSEETKRAMLRSLRNRLL
jgi:methionyl-tRNA formyltransferase